MTRREWLAPATIALLALAATVTSIGHDFTFDDRYVILSNGHVHELSRLWRLFGQSYWPRELGADGYRPVVMTLFTLQWVAGGGAPWVFHLVNILLAVATALAVFWCASVLLPRHAAWVAAALFAVHPVHVEVTGNVVGQSELIVALTLSIAVGVYLRARQAGMLRPRDQLAILGLYAVGLLAKEHAIVLPAILIAAEWTVLRQVPWRDGYRSARLAGLSFIAVTLAYFLARGLVLQGITGFVPFPVFRYLRMSALERVGTMMTEIPRIARLLVFPTRLSGDYSPTEVIVSTGPELVQLPGVVICVGVVALAVALRKRSPVASFGLLWLMIAFLPVSNFLVPTGFITAERTLFFPSVGVVLVAGAIIQYVRAREQRVAQHTATAAVGLLLMLGLARSIDRQRVWKNNEVFFEQLVRDVPNSYRAHFLRGRNIGQQLRLRETELEYKRAIRLFPYDVSMMVSIAADYYRAGLCGPSVALLRWSFAIDSTVKGGRYEFVECLGKEGHWAEARTEALKAMQIAPPHQLRAFRAALARADSALGRRRPPRVVAARVSQSARDSAESRSIRQASSMVR